MKTVFKSLTQAVLILFISSYSFSQNIEIFHQNGKFIIDENINLIVSNMNLDAYQNLENTESLTINLNNSIYEFNTIPTQIEYGKQYLVNLNSIIYKLYLQDLIK